jgi:hypothetical protein
MLYKIIFTVLLLSSMIFPQYQISGYVLEIYTDSPLDGVKVKLLMVVPQTSSDSTITDATGFFHLSNRPSGVYDIEIIRENTKEYSVDGLVVTQDTMFENIYLKPKSTYTGDVSGVWTKDNNPYFIDGHVNVPSKLEIMKGCEVFLLANSRLYIYDSLIIKGTENDSVFLHGDGSIGRHASGTYLNISYCKIEANIYDTEIGIIKNNTIKNCIVDYCDSTFAFPNLNMENNVIINATVEVMKGDIQHNTFLNSEFRIFHRYSPFIITNNIFDKVTVFGSPSADVEYNNFSAGFPPNIGGGIGGIAITNVNGDSCDFFYNISEDPMIANSATGELHESSPCIGAGKDGVDIGTYQLNGVSIEKNISLIENTNYIINFPNPFRPKTIITFPNRNRNASIDIYSLQGKRVKTFKDIAEKQVKWNATGQPSGIYVVKVNAGKKILKKRIVLVK